MIDQELPSPAELTADETIILDKEISRLLEASEGIVELIRTIPFPRNTIILQIPEVELWEPEKNIINKLDLILAQSITNLRQTKMAKFTEKLIDRLLFALEIDKKPAISITYLLIRLFDTMDCLLAATSFTYRGIKLESKYSKLYAGQQLDLRKLKQV